MNEEQGGGASRSTEPAIGSSSGTDVSLREHLAQQLHDAQRRIDERDKYLRDADYRFYEERDRRYTEVNIEKEKALKIKETADLAALGLAREIQTYKDEKANELREQINSERGFYLSREEYNVAHNALIDKLEAAIKPVDAFIAGQQGRSLGFDNFSKLLIALVGIGLTILTIYLSRH